MTLKKVINQVKTEDLPKDKKKRVFWREIIQTEIKENTGVSEKKLEEKLEKQKEEYKREVSALHPLEDFKEMIENKYEDLTIIAIKQMQAVIIKFIKESFKGSYYVKALDCIKALREACITEEEPKLFNKFLEELRSGFPNEKYLDLWKLIVDNRVSLITNEEAKDADVTKDQSENFLASLNKQSVNIDSSTLKEIDDLIADID